MRGPTQLGARGGGGGRSDGAAGWISRRWLLCGPLSKAPRALSTAGRLISPRYFALTAANA